MEGKKTRVKTPSQKILILSYYWPPSGGSGVQRWMYFAKHLKLMGWEPIVITVDEQQAAYAVWDSSLLAEVASIRVIKTPTREPLRWYSLLTTGNAHKGIPQGAVHQKSVLGKIAAYIRGNYFIPDARKGWIPYAVKAAKKVLETEAISHLITTGPPHSTHLAGLQLKALFDLHWWADFRDPWTEVFYNKDLFRSAKTQQKDRQLEQQVLQTADGVLTTLGGAFHEQLKRKAPQQRFVALPNGYEAELMAATPGERPKEVFHVVYTGLLTENQSYTPVLKALDKIAEQLPVRLSLAGNIGQEIITDIRSKHPNIALVFHGYVSHGAAIQLMKSAHLLLNFIFENADTQMISGKLLEYMATGVPLLSIGNPSSAAGKFVDQGSAAKMLEARDTKGIFDFIQQAATQRTNLHNSFPQLAHWSREALTKRLVEEVLLGK